MAQAKQALFHVPDVRWAHDRLRRGNVVRCDDLASYRLKIEPIVFFKENGLIKLKVIMEDGEIRNEPIAKITDTDWLDEIFACTTWTELKKTDKIEPIAFANVKKLRILTFNVSGAHRLIDALKNTAPEMRFSELRRVSDELRRDYEYWDQAIINAMVVSALNIAI